MTPKQKANLQAGLALHGLAANVTRNPGDVTRVAVSAGHGPVVQFVILDGHAPLRIDPPCPDGQAQGDWADICQRVACVVEPLLIH